MSALIIKLNIEFSVYIRLSAILFIRQLLSLYLCGVWTTTIYTIYIFNRHTSPSKQIIAFNFRVLFCFSENRWKFITNIWCMWQFNARLYHQIEIIADEYSFHYYIIDFKSTSVGASPVLFVSSPPCRFEIDNKQSRKMVIHFISSVGFYRHLLILLFRPSQGKRA